MDIELDRNSSSSLRSQIADAIRRQIEGGALPVGTRLASGRDMAERLQVNRATVLQSLRDLQDEGWIEAGVGRGTFVRGNPTSKAPRARFDWSSRVELNGSGSLGQPVADSDNAVPLSRAVAHRGFFPREAIEEAFHAASHRHGDALFDYPGPAGFEPLRACLRQRLERNGFDLSNDEVIIVNGSQQGIDLIARLLLRGAPTVLTSRPTFSGALDVFRECGSTVVGIPLDPEGLCIEALESELTRRPYGFLYTIPSFHNPTGLTMTERRREAVLELAARYDLPIIEDDWLGPLRVAGEPAPLKVLDNGDGRVIHVSTVSKVLAPGLRVGWLIVPRELAPAVVDLKRRADLATSVPGQAVVLELFENGFFDQHTTQLREQFDRRRADVDRVLESHFPTEVQPMKPHQGMVTWLRFPVGLDAHRVVAAARERGIEVTTGAPFDPGGGPEPGMRISYATADAEVLVPALEKLGQVLQESVDAMSTTSGPPLV